MAVKYKTYDEFEKAYLGKAIDYDKSAGVQCVDLADQYLKDCFDITGVWVSGARELYSNFNNWPAMVKNFDRIKNSRSLIAQKGDIVVWNGGKWGHVGICTGKGDIDWFECIEQNTLGKHEPTQKVTHYYNKRTGVDSCYPVSGVLRPKDQKRILGITAKKTTTTTTTTSSSPKQVSTYNIQVTAKSGLNVRSTPGMKGTIKTVVPYNYIYGIVAEQVVNGETWGKLMSGAGWINLKYTKKTSFVRK